MLIERLVERAGHTRWFAAVMKRLIPPVDLLLYRRFGGRGAGPPTLLLTTVGRKSGRERTVPLSYVRHGDGIAVVASNWGQRHHPAWSENLLANPEAQVRIGREVLEYRARRANPEEKARIWPRFVEMWPAYDTYRTRSGRDIRVFILEPR